MATATGTFALELVPLASDEQTEGAALGRMSIHKIFFGDIEGVGKGQVLSAITTTEGSAGYVTIEHFTGTVHGKRGTFVLQHMGTLNRGKPTHTITIVPDSGTGELSGITGTLHIRFEDGKTFYAFEYTI